jgi:hypothetical protein
MIPLEQSAARRRMHAFHPQGAYGGDCLIPWLLWA